MIYKLIVNAAFLAIGYYIGKEVSRSEFIRGELVEPRKSAEKAADKPHLDTSKKSRS
jgi:hypothetical protein